MRGPLIALCFVALSLAWLVFFGAGMRQADWNATMLFLGATALFYWTFRSGQTPPRIATWLTAALWALPAYVIFQLIPLPSGLLQVLSPARKMITESLAGVLPNLGDAPISVAPAATMFGLFGLLAYLLVFSLIRDLGWRLAATSPWLAAAPLAVIAAVEGCVGMGQWLSGAGLSGSSNFALRGTFLNSEYFCGFLEVAFPFTMVFGFISFRRHQTMETPSSQPAVRAAVSWLASLVMLLTLFHAPSQTSHVVVFGSLFILLAFSVVPRLKTRMYRFYGAGGAAVVAFAILMVAASPSDVLPSPAELGASDKANTEARAALWNSAGSLFDEYHLMGTGMGGFESTFLKYQGSTDLNRIQSPHNDVLLLLITFGMAGAVIVLVALVGVMRPPVMGAIYLEDEGRRLLAVAITAALAGVLIRGALESSVSMPVVGMAFAWVAGMGQANGLD